MKSTKIFTLLLIASSFFANAQEKQQVKKLPREATTFLDANFKGIQIQEMHREKEGTSFKYEVTLVNGAEIEFNSRGRWIELESNTVSLPTTMLQSSVGTYIKKTYPNAIVTEVKKGIRFNFVEINNETMLQFDTEGNFYKILK
ncbi:PepSY-like domain-containing protein [Flavobacterium sp. SM2513]|uniref:PepSY-like domain-containing protein n=1 Tax=Flavobacterium sp. SM2513 TaxID=3424766 RepID=UPI003D7FB02C